MSVKIADHSWYKAQYEELDWPEFNQAVKKRYDELVKQKRIVFTTFHQSFAYEDFVEGIRANTNQNGGLEYKVEPGVFKELCSFASSHVTKNLNERIELSGRRIWKMSLGNTQKGEEHIYTYCMDNNCVLLGYGNDIDFSECKTRRQIKECIEKETGNKPKNRDYTVTSVNQFKNEVSDGDVVIISDGNRKFRAIGIFNGSYEFLPEDSNSLFQQKRNVTWLRVYEPSKPRENIFKKELSQASIYELNDDTVDRDRLAQLLSNDEQLDDFPQPHVLIIDEINRGNISRISGELITLLEPSKRDGQPDARVITLPYSKKQFSVPSNVYVIGTMNTADKSLAQLDLALRRRFNFVELPPKSEHFSGLIVHGVDIEKMLNVINGRIELLLDRDHLIGHSYFFDLLEAKSDEARQNLLASIFRNKIIPLLKEYFFDDWERIRWVLNDDEKDVIHQFVHTGSRHYSTAQLFSKKVADQIDSRLFYVNEEVFGFAEAYQGIVKGYELESA
ncbi:MAG: AAA family ATPase [Colwellia sp.]|jgi:GTPase subunit of restriction endonuclease